MKKIIFFAFTFCACLSAFSQHLQLVVPIGHSRRVVAMDLSHDKKWLASIDGSAQIKLWNYATGKETYQLTEHTRAVNSIQFHPAKPILASASDSSIRLWDDQGRLIRTISSTEHISHVQFSFTGDSIIAVGEHIQLWNTASGLLLDKLILDFQDITAIAYVKKSNLLAIGNKKGAVALLDLRQGEVVNTLQATDQQIASVSFASDGAVLLIATGTGEVIKLDLATQAIQKIDAFNIRSHQVIPIGDLAFACGRDTEQHIKQFRISDLTPLPSELSFDIDKNNEAFQFGIRAIFLSSDTTLLVADYNQRIVEWNIKNRQWEKRQFEGSAAPVYGLAINQDQNKLAIASGHEAIKVLDLTGTGPDKTLPGSTLGMRSVDFHPVNPVVAAYGMDEQIIITDLLSGESILNLKATGAYTSTPVTFDPSGKYILRKSSKKNFDLYDFNKHSPRQLKVKDGFDFEFTRDGRNLVVEVKDGIAVYDAIGLKLLKTIEIPGIQDFTLSASGAVAVLLSDDRTILHYGRNFDPNGEIQLAPEASSDKVFKAPGQKLLIGIRNTRKVSEMQADFSIKLIDPETGALKGTLSGHSGFVTSLVFLKNQYLLTASVDGEVKLWDLTSQTYIGSIIPLHGEEYVVTSPTGHFDATPGGMKKLHYVQKGEIIALDQLKAEYYEPRLLSKLLGFNTEPIKRTADVTTLKLHPELSIRHPLINDGKLGINLQNKGGGIGQVVILINGKEVSSDIRSIGTVADRSALEIDYDITDHPFLYNDRVNKVTVKAYNQDGTLSSEEKSIYVFGEETSTEKPKLFAIIAGTSDYKGNNLDLKYAAKDATDFAQAITLSASQYVGAENTHITLLTTDQDTAFWPTKKHIQEAFNAYSKEAKAKDVLIVYLSGHGVNHHGENGDFYYLTSEASGGDLNDADTRTSAAISSAEFTEYIKSVAALKQILVIDACHSGQLASSLATARSAMSSTQIRSLERMKDRTGLFVLAGSAADAVSYETTLFGQGLLTYSLLFGMKGAALRDDEFIDVIQLFQFAANKVPELAEEIGGIQKPEIRLPDDGKTFDIGRLTKQDREKIIIKAPKPIFVHSRFQDESAIFDRLQVGELMDQMLLSASKEKDPPIVFVDDKSFSGAATIHGRYYEKDGLLKAKIMLERSNEVTQEFEVEAVNTRLLAEAIYKQLTMEPKQVQ